MLAWLAASSTVTQALVATLGTYLLTAVGTLPVFFLIRAPTPDGRDDGVCRRLMVAASCWSLLVPAIARGGVSRPPLDCCLAGRFCMSPTNAPAPAR